MAAPAAGGERGGRARGRRSAPAPPPRLPPRARGARVPATPPPRHPARRSGRADAGPGPGGGGLGAPGARVGPEGCGGRLGPEEAGPETCESAERGVRTSRGRASRRALPRGLRVRTIGGSRDTPLSALRDREERKAGSPSVVFWMVGFSF